MMTLIACIGITFGLCGHYVQADYQSVSSCHLALRAFDGKPDVAYAFCKPKGEKP